MSLSMSLSWTSDNLQDYSNQDGDRGLFAIGRATGDGRGLSYRATSYLLMSAGLLTDMSNPSPRRSIAQSPQAGLLTAPSTLLQMEPARPAQALSGTQRFDVEPRRPIESGRPASLRRPPGPDYALG